MTKLNFVFKLLSPSVITNGLIVLHPPQHTVPRNKNSHPGLGKSVRTRDDDQLPEWSTDSVDFLMHISYLLVACFHFRPEIVLTAERNPSVDQLTFKSDVGWVRV